MRHNTVKSQSRVEIISQRICDTDKSEVVYVAKDTWGKEIRGCRVHNRITPLNKLIEMIQKDLQGVL